MWLKMALFPITHTEVSSTTSLETTTVIQESQNAMVTAGKSVQKEYEREHFFFVSKKKEDHEMPELFN